MPTMAADGWQPMSDPEGVRPTDSPSILTTTNLTVVSSAMNHSPLPPQSLGKILDRIRGDHDDKFPAEVEAIAEVRELVAAGKDDGARVVKTTRLAAFVPGGVFTYVNDAGLIAHSQCCVVDYDKLEPEEVALLRGRGEDLPGCIAAFVSPSARGVKFLVLLSPRVTAGSHKSAALQVFDAYDAKLGLECDRKNQDVCRLCFFSRDPHLMTWPHAEPFQWDPKKSAPEVRRESGKAPKAYITPEDVRAAPKGERNDGLFKAVVCAAERGRLTEKLEAEYAAVAREIGLLDTEIPTTIDSARKRGEKSRAKRVFPGKPATVREIARLLAGCYWEHRYNARADACEMRPKGEGAWARRNDRVTARFRATIPERFKLQRGDNLVPLVVGRDLGRDLLNAHAYDHAVDPFCLWLESLPPWDGVSRNPIAECFPSVAEHPLVDWAGLRGVTLAAVRRAYEPGGRVQEMVVLQGATAIGKSAMFVWLLPPDQRGDWFTDGMRFDLDDKRLVETMQGRVLCEFAEMSGATRSDNERIKAFLTRTDDGAVRKSYREDPEKTPRRCVFVGTTNNSTCLPNDPTGTRRFVPVPVLETDPGHVKHVTEWLNVNRAQVWAEALHRYRAGEPHHLPHELVTVHRENNEEFRATDDNAEAIVGEYMELRPGHINFAEMRKWVHQYHRDDPPTDGRLARAMENAGFKRRVVRCEGGKQKRWWVQVDVTPVTPVTPNSPYVPETQDLPITPHAPRTGTPAQGGVPGVTGCHTPAEPPILDPMPCASCGAPTRNAETGECTPCRIRHAAADYLSIGSAAIRIGRTITGDERHAGVRWSNQRES